MTIQYDTPIEVTARQYDIIMHDFAGFVLGRQDEETGKYYIKVWGMRYADDIEEIIMFD